jgi:hypothetical protein
LTLPNEDDFSLDIMYYPEQVVPNSFRSSVYMFVTEQDGNYNNDCAWGFDFGTGSGGGHSSLQNAVGRNCMTETGDVDSYPKTYEGVIDYWVCLGQTINVDPATACDRVDVATTGFDNQNLDSLRAEHFCKKFQYDLSVNVTSGGVNSEAQFVMDYIRDPIDTGDLVEFFGADGASQPLEEVVEWAICDYNDLGDIQYEECFARMAPTPPARVLDMSTASQSNPFSTVFALQGLSDQSLVNDEFPLSIDLTQSSMHLFHASYAGFYDTCDAADCTDVTTDILSSLVIREFGNSADVNENWHVALEGGMPIFDEASTQNCDENFCTFVLNLLFRSKFERRRLQLVLPYKNNRQLSSIFEDKSFVDPSMMSENSDTFYRVLQESAEQSKGAKVKAVRSESGPGLWIGVGIGSMFTAFAAFVVYKRRKSTEEDDEIKSQHPSNDSVFTHDDELIIV